MDNNSLIKVTILNREELIFSGKVVSISSINEKGEFDILGSHQNFISLIKEKVVMRYDDGTGTQYPIDKGILHVLNNEVKVFLGIGG